MLRLALWSKLHATQFVAHCDQTSIIQNKEDPKQLPSRDASLRALKAQKEYDLLIIGGGATGAGRSKCFMQMLGACVKNRFIHHI